MESQGVLSHRLFLQARYLRLALIDRQLLRNHWGSQRESMFSSITLVAMYWKPCESIISKLRSEKRIERRRGPRTHPVSISSHTLATCDLVCSLISAAAKSLQASSARRLLQYRSVSLGLGAANFREADWSAEDYKELDRLLFEIEQATHGLVGSVLRNLRHFKEMEDKEKQNLVQAEEQRDVEGTSSGRERSSSKMVQSEGDLAQVRQSFANALGIYD